MSYRMEVKKIMRSEVIRILFLFLFFTNESCYNTFLSLLFLSLLNFSIIYSWASFSLSLVPFWQTKLIYLRVKRVLITSLISVEVQPMMSSSKPDADLPPSLWWCCCCCCHVDVHIIHSLKKDKNQFKPHISIIMFQHQSKIEKTLPCS